MTAALSLEYGRRDSGTVLSKEATLAFKSAVAAASDANAMFDQRVKTWLLVETFPLSGSPGRFSGDCDLYDSK